LPGNSEGSRQVEASGTHDGVTPDSRPAASSTAVLAVPLLAVDAMLLAAYVIHVVGIEVGAPVLASTAWNGNLDGSYVELFGHLQLILVVVALLVIFNRRRTAVYGVWALVFCTLVADDFLRLHERGGHALVRGLSLPAAGGLRPQDLGELTVWAVGAVILGPALLAAHLLATATARRHSSTLTALVLALAAFVVIMDMLHQATDHRLPVAVGRALTLTETAGELIVMTLMLLAAYRMTPPPADEPTSPPDAPPPPPPAPPPSAGAPPRPAEAQTLAYAPPSPGVTGSP